MRIHYYLIAALGMLFLSGCSDPTDTQVTPDPDPAPFTGVRVLPSTLSIWFSQMAQLAATRYVDGVRDFDDNSVYEWSSSNEEVATVSESGLVTPVGAGTTTIRARSAEGESEATIEVLPLALYVTFTYHSATDRYPSLSATTIPSPQPGLQLRGTAAGVVRLLGTRVEYCRSGFCEAQQVDIPTTPSSSTSQFDITIPEGGQYWHLTAYGAKGESIRLSHYQWIHPAPQVTLTSILLSDPSVPPASREITVTARVPKQPPGWDPDSIAAMRVTIGSGPVHEIPVQRDTAVTYSWTASVSESSTKAWLFAETTQGHTRSESFTIP